MTLQFTPAPPGGQIRFKGGSAWPLIGYKLDTETGELAAIDHNGEGYSLNNAKLGYPYEIWYPEMEVWRAEEFGS